MKIDNETEVLQAEIKDHSVIQNMARFYVYDMAKYCGFDRKEWSMPDDGLYECFDFKRYFVEADRKVFIVKVNNELAGFVLLNKAVTSKDSNWSVGEFFIISRFQNSGIGFQVASKIWIEHPGGWELLVHPKNARALQFWRKSVKEFTGDFFEEKLISVDFDKEESTRIAFYFEAKDVS
jgi:predicted acetyltransferase